MQTPTVCSRCCQALIIVFALNVMAMGVCRAEGSENDFQDIIDDMDPHKTRVGRMVDKAVDKAEEIYDKVTGQKNKDDHMTGPGYDNSGDEKVKMRYRDDEFRIMEAQERKREAELEREREAERMARVREVERRQRSLDQRELLGKSDPQAESEYMQKKMADCLRRFRPSPTPLQIEVCGREIAAIFPSRRRDIDAPKKAPTVEEVQAYVQKSAAECLRRFPNPSPGQMEVCVQEKTDAYKNGAR